jgi:hypothetical protein
MLIKVSAYLKENKNYRLKAKEEQDNYFFQPCYSSL